jgi:hypothetical protein
MKSKTDVATEIDLNHANSDGPGIRGWKTNEMVCKITPSFLHEAFAAQKKAWLSDATRFAPQLRTSQR